LQKEKRGRRHLFLEPNRGMKIGTTTGGRARMVRGKKKTEERKKPDRAHDGSMTQGASPRA